VPDSIYAPIAVSNLSCAEAAIAANATAAKRALRSLVHSFNVRPISVMQQLGPGGITTPKDKEILVHVNVQKKTTLQK